MDDIFGSVECLIHDKLMVNGEELTPFNINKEKIKSVISKEINNKIPISQRIDYISYLFNLDENEKNILTTLFLFEIIPNYDKVFAFLNGDINRNYPTVSTFPYLLSKNEKYNLSIYSYFSEEKPLLKFGIIKIEDEDLPLAQKSVKIDRVIKKYLLDGRCLKSNNFISVSTFNTLNSNNIDKDLLKLIENHDVRFIFNLVGKNKIKKEFFSFSVASKKGLGLVVVKPEFFENSDLTQIEELFKSSFFDGYCLFFKEFDKIRNDHNYRQIIYTLKENIHKFSWAVFFDTEEIITDIQIDNFLLDKNSM